MKPFACENCIECCANVALSPKEAVQLRRHVRTMDAELVERLRNQERDAGVCPFADTEAKRCTVYDVRPWICRKFGFVERMQCSYNQHIPLEPFGESMVDFAEHYGGVNQMKSERFEDTDILGVTITWEHGLLKRF